MTLNVLDKEDVIMVRSCIPGNEARDICFSLLNVICSYTCRNIQKEKSPKLAAKMTKAICSLISYLYFSFIQKEYEKHLKRCDYYQIIFSMPKVLYIKPKNIILHLL